MGDVKHTAGLPEILPCPFCGGPASVEEVSGSTSDYKSVAFSVGCDDRGEADCMGYQALQTFSRRSDAINAWNKRAPSNAHDEMVAALRETVLPLQYLIDMTGGQGKDALARVEAVLSKAKEK